MNTNTALPIPDKPTMRLGEAAPLLDYSRSSAYAAVRDGTWPTRVITVGKSIRIPTAELRALLGV